MDIREARNCIAIFVYISQSFQQKGSAELKCPSSCSLGSRSTPWCTKASPTPEHWWHLPFSHTGFLYHTAFSPSLCFESPPSTGLQALLCPPGLEFGSRDQSGGWEEEKNGTHNPQTWATQILCFKPDPGWMPSQPKRQGGKISLQAGTYIFSSCSLGKHQAEL